MRGDLGGLGPPLPLLLAGWGLVGAGECPPLRHKCEGLQLQRLKNMYAAMSAAMITTPLMTPPTTPPVCKVLLAKSVEEMRLCEADKEVVIDIL